MDPVAPARYVLTAVHLANDDHTRTLCGKPMDEDGLWQPVDFTDPPCRACQHVATKPATTTRISGPGHVCTDACATLYHPGNR